MEKAKKLDYTEKVLKIIEKLNDKYCLQYYQSIHTFNPTENNISFGKMIASTEIREAIISQLLKEVKKNA